MSVSVSRMVNRERGCVRCRGPVERCVLFEVFKKQQDCKLYPTTPVPPSPRCTVQSSKSALARHSPLNSASASARSAEAPEAAKARLNDCEKMVPILHLVALRFLRVKRPEDVGHRNAILSL